MVDYDCPRYIMYTAYNIIYMSRLSKQNAISQEVVINLQDTPTSHSYRETAAFVTTY